MVQYQAPNPSQEFSDDKPTSKNKKSGWRYFSRNERTSIQQEKREITIGQPSDRYQGNRISTTKYTPWTFFPLNLLYQFTKPSNLYFLFCAILQLIPDVSDSDGFPSYLPPLLFIVALSMIKDGYEDYKRYKSDQEENNKETSVYRSGAYQTIKWKDVQVGELLKVNQDEFIPADMVLLCSSLFRKGQCYIETKNLDGETNLKSQYVPEELRGKMNSAQDVEVD